MLGLAQVRGYTFEWRGDTVYGADWRPRSGQRVHGHNNDWTTEEWTAAATLGTEATWWAWFTQYGNRRFPPW